MRQNKTKQQPDVTTAYKSRIREWFSKWAVPVKFRLAREPFHLRPQRTSLHHSSSNQMAAVTSCFKSVGSRSSPEGMCIGDMSTAKLMTPTPQTHGSGEWRCLPLAPVLILPERVRKDQSIASSSRRTVAWDCSPNEIPLPRVANMPPRSTLSFLAACRSISIKAHGLCPTRLSCMCVCLLSFPITQGMLIPKPHRSGL